MSDRFTEKEKDGLVWMTADVISANHAFTTRFGGTSRGGYSALNLGFSRGDVQETVIENHRRLGKALGIDSFSAGFTKQSHGTEIRIITKSDVGPPWDLSRPDCDGVVTKEKGIPLFCFTADCIPVLLHDPVSSVAAAVHCGWRSSVDDILGNAVEKMTEQGATRQNVCAALGPAIGTCCFEISEDVAEELRRYLNGDTDGVLFAGEKVGKYYADLREANRRRLISLGVQPQKIAVSKECTKCSNEKYWSHRFVGDGERGSQCAIICM